MMSLHCPFHQLKISTVLIRSLHITNVRKVAKLRATLQQPTTVAMAVKIPPTIPLIWKNWLSTSKTRIKCKLKSVEDWQPISITYRHHSSPVTNRWSQQHKNVKSIKHRSRRPRCNIKWWLVSKAMVPSALKVSPLIRTLKSRSRKTLRELSTHIIRWYIRLLRSRSILLRARCKVRSYRPRSR